MKNTSSPRGRSPPSTTTCFSPSLVASDAHRGLVAVQERPAVLGDQPAGEVVAERPAAPAGAVGVGLVDGRGDRVARALRPQHVRAAKAGQARADDRDPRAALAALRCGAPSAAAGLPASAAPAASPPAPISSSRRVDPAASRARSRRRALSASAAPRISSAGTPARSPSLCAANSARARIIPGDRADRARRPPIPDMARRLDRGGHYGTLMPDSAPILRASSTDTISRPIGSSDTGIILKFARPSGMPMIVMHCAMPVSR